MEKKTEDFKEEYEFIKKFYNSENLNDMRLDENLTMKDVYDELQSKINYKEKEFDLKINEKVIKIKNYRYEAFDLIFQNFEILELFIHPITATIKTITKDLKKITFISAQHYNIILSKNGILNFLFLLDPIELNKNFNKKK